MKKFLLTISIIFLVTVPAYALLGQIEYEGGVPIDYSKLDISIIRKDALFYMLQWEAAQDKNLKQEYLTKAMLNYHILTRMVPEEVHPYVSIGRMYDGINKYSKAKEYLYRATNIEPLNPEANYYFGEFYFKRDELRRSLPFYKRSLENGWGGEYRLNYRLAVIYEKLGDINKAVEYYKICAKLNPEDKTLAEKIRLLEDLKYEETGYYFHRE